MRCVIAKNHNYGVDYVRVRFHCLCNFDDLWWVFLHLSSLVVIFTWIIWEVMILLQWWWFNVYLILCVRLQYEKCSYALLQIMIILVQSGFKDDSLRIMKAIVRDSPECQVFTLLYFYSFAVSLSKWMKYL